MEKFAQPEIGMRFAMHGARFEITFIANGIIRYAASAGGRPYKLSNDKFIELQEQGTIVRSGASGLRLTQANAQSLVRRHRYIEAVRRQLVRPTARGPLAAVIKQVAAELDDTSPPAISTLARWVHGYQRLGAQGIERQQFSGNRSIRFDMEVERLIGEAIHQIFLSREKRDARDVRAHVIGKLAEVGLCDAHSEKVKLPSLRTIQRRLKELDPYIVIRAQRGDLAANRVIRAAGRMIKSGAILSIVQIDSHVLDVLVVDPDSGDRLVRPYLTCILDVHTRVIVGTYVSLYPPSALTALAALKDMLVRFGIPAQIVPDLGVEFINNAFTRLCVMLSITITPAQVRDPNSKANIESFFRNLTYSLIQKMCGTTFSSPAKRGDYDPAKHACHTLEQVKSYIDEWIDQSYHRTVHSRTLRAPIIAWEELAVITPPLKMSVEDVNAMARRPVLRFIQHGRVRVDGNEYFSHALATCQAQGESQVTVLVDDLDLNTVLVQHPTDQSILIEANSTDPHYTRGLTRYAHREAMLIKRSMSAADRRKLGKNANALARARLMERINGDSRASKKWIAKLTAGKGRKQSAESQQAAVEQTTDSHALPALPFSPASRPIAGPEPTPPQQPLPPASPFDTFDLE